MTFNRLKYKNKMSNFIPGLQSALYDIFPSEVIEVIRCHLDVESVMKTGLYRKIDNKRLLHLENKGVIKEIIFEFHHDPNWITTPYTSYSIELPILNPTICIRCENRFDIYAYYKLSYGHRECKYEGDIRFIEVNMKTCCRYRILYLSRFYRDATIDQHLLTGFKPNILSQNTIERFESKYKHCLYLHILASTIKFRLWGEYGPYDV